MWKNLLNILKVSLSLNIDFFVRRIMDGGIRNWGRSGREPIHRYETCQQETSLQIALKPTWRMIPYYAQMILKPYSVL